MVIPDRTQFRDTTRYAAAVATEVAAPLLRAYAAVRVHAAATSPGAWRSGLIAGSGHIGDVLYRSCSLGHLIDGLPLCSWSYLTTRDGAEILRNTPGLGEVLPFNGDSVTDFLPPHTPRDLREHRFDVILCTDNIEHHRCLRLAIQLGIPNRVAFVQKGFSGLTTYPVRTQRASWPAQIRAMFEEVTGSPDASELRPRMYINAEEREAALREWNGLPFGDANLTIAVSMTSRQRIGVFPTALFVSILRLVLQLCPGARVVLTGTQAESAALRSVAREIGSRVVVLAGTLSLREFAAFLPLCDVFLGADSGPRHLANAAGVPVFFVRNMAVPEIEAGTYCETETDIAPPGQYLSTTTAMSRLDGIDRNAVASAVIATARRRRSNGSSSATQIR